MIRRRPPPRRGAPRAHRVRGSCSSERLGLGGLLLRGLGRALALSPSTALDLDQARRPPVPRQPRRPPRPARLGLATRATARRCFCASRLLAVLLRVIRGGIGVASSGQPPRIDARLVARSSSARRLLLVAVEHHAPRSSSSPGMASISTASSSERLRRRPPGPAASPSPPPSPRSAGAPSAPRSRGAGLLVGGLRGLRAWRSASAACLRVAAPGPSTRPKGSRPRRASSSPEVGRGCGGWRRAPRGEGGWSVRPTGQRGSRRVLICHRVERNPRCAASRTPAGLGPGPRAVAGPRGAAGSSEQRGSRAGRRSWRRSSGFEGVGAQPKRALRARGAAPEIGPLARAAAAPLAARSGVR